MLRTVLLRAGILGLALGLVACGGSQPATQTAATADCSSCEAELERARAEAATQRRLATERADVYRQLREQLASLIDAGSVRLTFRRGLLVLQLPNRVLFASGQAIVSDEGRSALGDIAQVLARIEGRRFLVSGHTDDQPIRAAAGRFETNWELSTARGVSVLKVLLEAGLPADRMGAAGFGEFDPEASNDSDEGRATNRRTELVIIPNLEGLLGRPE